MQRFMTQKDKIHEIPYQIIAYARKREEPAGISCRLSMKKFLFLSYKNHSKQKMCQKFDDFVTVL